MLTASTAAINEDYRDLIDSELAECDVQIQELKARVEQVLMEAEIKYYRRIETLRIRQQVIREKLLYLAQLHGRALYERQAEIQEQLDRLKQSIDDALAEIN